ncbi:MAG TPA: hypothetical protein VLS85_07200 [Hanamia sp.]|nr:hypothetical protein [Hanamia sp.]
MKTSLIKIIGFVLLVSFIATGCEHGYYIEKDHHRSEYHQYHHDNDHRRDDRHDDD